MVLTVTPYATADTPRYQPFTGRISPYFLMPFAWVPSSLTMDAVRCSEMLLPNTSQKTSIFTVTTVRTSNLRAVTFLTSIPNLNTLVQCIRRLIEGVSTILNCNSLLWCWKRLSQALSESRKHLSPYLNGISCSVLKNRPPWFILPFRSCSLSTTRRFLRRCSDPRTPIQHHHTVIVKNCSYESQDDICLPAFLLLVLPSVTECQRKEVSFHSLLKFFFFFFFSVLLVSLLLFIHNCDFQSFSHNRISFVV